MSFFTLIIFIYVAVIIAKSVKSAKNGNADRENTMGNGQRKTPLDSYRGTYKEAVYPPKQETRQNAPYSPKAQNTVAEKSAAKRIVQHTTVRPKQEAEQSTVDYLARKAEQETQDTYARRSASAQQDGRKTAVRLMEGDLPPAGTRVIKCHYCGADNLIPQNAGGKFACYFCREDL